MGDSHVFNIDVELNQLGKKHLTNTFGICGVVDHDLENVEGRTERFASLIEVLVEVNLLVGIIVSGLELNTIA